MTTTASGCDLVTANDAEQKDAMLKVKINNDIDQYILILLFWETFAVTGAVDQEKTSSAGV